MKIWSLQARKQLQTLNYFSFISVVKKNI